MLARRVTAQDKRSFSLLGAQATPLAVGADTADGWEAIELVLSPGAASPLHTLSADKLFYVASGEMTLTLGDESAVGSAGGFVQVPAGTPHRYLNDSGASATMVVVTSGAAQVPFLVGMSELSAQGRPDPEKLAEHTAAFGVRLLAAAAG